MPPDAPDWIDWYHAALATTHFDSTCEGIAAAVSTHGLAIHGESMVQALRPLFVEAATFESARTGAARVHTALEALCRWIAADPVRRLGPMRVCAPNMPNEGEPREIDPAEAAALLSLDADTSELVGRFDGALGPDGVCRLIEYNPGLPGGPGVGEATSDVFEALPIVRAFAARWPLAPMPSARALTVATMQRVLARRGCARWPAQLAIVTTGASSTRPEDYPDGRYALAALVAAGCRLESVPHETLVFRDGALFAGAYRVDVALVDAWRPILATHGGEHPVLQALRARAVWLPSGVAHLLTSNKGLFERLRDPAFLATRPLDERDAIRTHVPWTCTVRDATVEHEDASVDLLRWIEAHRDELVIKPATGYGGVGVVMGWHCDDAQWRDALANALRSPHVVQSRVAFRREAFPFLEDGGLAMQVCATDLDPYIWGNDLAAGAYSRVAGGDLLNQTTGGATTTPVFVVGTLPR